MKFAITKDINGVPCYGLPFTVDNYQLSLEVVVPQTVIAPTAYNRMVAVFSYEPGAKVWVALNPKVDITPPSGVNPNPSVAQMNPAIRECGSGDAIQFVTSDNLVEVGVSFYEID